MTRRCAVCGGLVRHVRTDRLDDTRDVAHYRCSDFEDGCRQGGHRVLEHVTDDVLVEQGPIFEGLTPGVTRP